MAKILSVEIDSCNIKINEAVKKGETLSICTCMSENIGYGVKNGKIVDINTVVNRISEILRNNNIKTKKAAFVINLSSIMIRTIKLPLLKKSTEIISMIQIELQQLISADLNKYRITYEISNITNENKVSYADYIVYCVPIDLISQYVDLAEKLNLNLIKIDILPTCINSLYKNNIKINGNSLSIKKTLAFINIKENVISFLVVRNGFCDFYISSEIEKAYIEKVAEPQYTYFDGENYLNKDNIIVSQITKFLRNYYSTSGNKVIDKIYIYGSCNLNTIIEIKDKLCMDVENINNISNLTIENTHNFELNVYFSIAAALFSHNKSNGFIAIKRKKVRNNYGYVVISAVILISSVYVFGFLNSQVEMRNKIQAMTLFIDDGNNNEINNKIENIKMETDYLEKYLKSAEILKQVIKENDYVDSSVLRKINMAKPSETKVTSIYMEKKSTQLQCLSSSMSEATLFFSNLREIEQIENVYIPAIQSKTGQAFSYSLVIQLKDVIENDN